MAEQKDGEQGGAGDIVLVCDPVILPQIATQTTAPIDTAGQFGVPPPVAPGLVSRPEPA